MRREEVRTEECATPLPPPPSSDGALKYTDGLDVTRYTVEGEIQPR